MDKKIVSITSPDSEEQPAKSYIEIPLRDGKFQQIPNANASKTSLREILYICGPSGSGKSTYTLNYLKQYKKKYPNGSFINLIPLYELGLWPIGIIEGKFVIAIPPCKVVFPKMK